MVEARDSARSRQSEPPHDDLPVSAMVESIVGCKWSMRLLALIADGAGRPSALLRSCPGLSAKVMNERLRKMIRFGILQRSVVGEKPPLEVTYRLTPFGERFTHILREIRKLQDELDQGVQEERACARQGSAPDRPPINQ